MNRNCLAIAFLFAAVLLGCQSKQLTSAKIYMQQRDWERAIEQLEEAVEIDADNPEVHFLLGQAHGRAGHFRDMNREFELSLMLDNKFEKQILLEREKYWIENYNKGVTRLDRQKYDEAELYLRTAIAIDARRSEAFRKLIVVYVNTQKPAKALELYAKLLRRHPDDIDLLSSTANLHYCQEEFSKVIPILQKVLSLSPDNSDALANMALTYEAMGEMEKALDAFKKAIRANPEDNDLVFLLGVHHYKNKAYPEAIRLFEKVLQKKPSDIKSVSNIGNAYLCMAEDLRLQLKSSKGEVLSAQSVKELKSQAIAHYSNAIPYLEKALANKPNQPEVWRNLGVAYINTGENEKGEEAFLKAEEFRIKSAK